ncbi:TonB-dependent receptor domain-containing protein [uncultured Parasphingorhabdus sp.]|uniref:TonB-dependent receptor n=1 Tax=uncultured Parasphingorhabdus sp. TaxID=2709694 RepID=UPI002AA91946|nr:TonB-dependent receptor [uncultured Parasphingorhabdus sp.]
MTRNSPRHKTNLKSTAVRSLLLSSAAATACAALASPALAQDSEGMDEPAIITVIARKQTETLQEVPVTVTAIGGDTLEKFQVNEIADVVSRVPALNVQVGGSGSGGQISLRGVGSSNISASFDSAVAFDFDGVQVSTMRMVQAGFFDVQQIDVLKGPQSLFFGKSASAGVFAIRSANPTQDWEVAGKASYEFEEKGYTLGGHISGPITDTLGIRVAAQYQDIEDYVKLAPGTPAFNPDGSVRDSRGISNFISRVTLQWDPVDNFNANLKLNYIKNKSDGAIGHTDVSCGANGVADPIYLLSGALVIPSNADCNSHDGLYHTSDGAAALVSNIPTGSGGDNTQFENGTPFGETEIFFGRLKWDLGLSDYLTLSSVSGYLSLDAVDTDCYSYVGELAPGVPGGAGCSDPVNQTEQFTQELRITSDFDGMFNFMIGAFYESRDIDFNTSQQGVNISFLGADPITGFTYDWYKKQNTKTEALSFFASATLDLTDQLELSGGVRWTDESKVSRITVPYVHSFLSAGPAFIPSGFFSGPINFSDSNFSPEASIKYQATPDINIYASFKTGFKSGGIDNSALPSSSLLGFNDPDPAVRQGVADALKFDSETGLGGEIGVKTQLANRTITLNTSVFYYVFDDLQVQNFDAAAVQYQTFNASQLTSQGVDVEWAWRTPVQGLNFSGSLAYTDAEFTAPFVTTSGEDINGRAAARAPKFAANAAFDWSIPMGDSLELGLNGNLQYSSSYFTNEDSLNDLKQDSYVSIDGSVSVGDPDGKWKLSLVGVNLTDKIWINTSAGRPFLEPGVGDDLLLTQNRGRQVFVEAAFKF